MRTLWQDLKYGLRMLTKSPGFTAVAVLTLALGIGTNTVIFSVVNAVLLRPLPYPNHDLLLRIGESHPGEQSLSVTYATYLDLAREAKTIENPAAFRNWVFNLTGDSEAQPERAAGALVSGNFFAALGSKPLLGRMITPEDNDPGGNNRVAVLGYALWQSRYGGRRDAVGKTIQVNSEPYAIVGVMPEGFDYPEKSKIWCPLVPRGGLHPNRRAHLLTVIADLHANDPLSAAQGELSSFARQVERQNPGQDDPGLGLWTIPLKANLVAPVRPALLILIFSVGLLLVIACANVANLLLARAAARRKEIAIRVALGAGRPRLARQLLTESVLLAALGGALGFFFVFLSLNLMKAINGLDIPRLAQVSIDGRVLAFTMAVTLFTGLLFGLAPALAGIRTDLNSSLKEGAAVGTGGTRRSVSEALMIPQFALAVVLLAGAGLLANSFVRLLRINPGFRSDHLLTAELFLSPAEYPEGDPRGAVLLDAMLQRVQAIPGVRSAGIVTALPITGGADTDFVIAGRPAPRPGGEPSADIRSASPGYFRTMGIPLLAGREFTEEDSARAPRVMLINETMARKFWPNANPIGQHVTMLDWGPPLQGEIVGVVGDVKTNGLDEVTGPMIYWPNYQFPQLFNSLVARSNADPMSLVAAVKSAVWSVDRNQTLSEIKSMDQVLADSLARRRLYMLLLGIFAAAALLLAAVGIYGVMAYSVSQRTHEIGVRLALGAERRDVLRLMLRRGMGVTLIGVAIGLAAAFGLTRLMSTLLYGVSASDPATFAGVAILLFAIALAACHIPARRAMRVDPMVALRYE
jgi:putative ABC transport system permease protein